MTNYAQWQSGLYLEDSRAKPALANLNPPSQNLNFGPSAELWKSTSVITSVQDPGSMYLSWSKEPQTVLVVLKIKGKSNFEKCMEFLRWLISDMQLTVYFNQTTDEDSRGITSKFQSIKGLQFFNKVEENILNKIDLIIGVGGYDTILAASTYFQESMPPVLSFHLGSLDFLTPFNIDNCNNHILEVIHGHACITLRTRLKCTFIKKELREERKEVTVLNDVVIDRGPSPYITSINLYFANKYITTIQGDGLILATPTGSTSYAMAAGASIIHPSVYAIIVAPICPHSLAFRPIIVPAGIEIQVILAEENKKSAWITFDGKHKEEMENGDMLIITTSTYSVPSVCADDQISDWFVSLGECLRWNIRRKQSSNETLSYISNVSEGTKLENSTNNFFDEFEDVD